MDYIITIDKNGSPSLQHYGVLGMKWGVRHDRERAYQRASKKAGKLQAKADRKTVKAKKAMSRMPSRALRHIPLIYPLYDFKVRSINAKQGSAARAQLKAEKWMKSMDKVFSETKLKDI